MESVKIDVTGRPPAAIIACNVTIDGKVYSYPKDFNYQETGHLEFNAITGDGTETIATTLIFNLPGKPTITEWLVLTVTGVGSPPNPFANSHFEGYFDITGTPFEKVLELLDNAKKKHQKELQDSREELLSAWQSITMKAKRE